MTDVADALAALSRVLTHLGLRWYVFGAQAAISWGAARVTKDVDVTVALGELSVSELIAQLDAAGFRSRATDLQELARTSRVLPVLYAATSTPVDLVLAGPGLEDAFLANTRERVIAGSTVPVAAAEDIVTMKLLAARPTDREDVVAMLRAQRGRFDDARVREMLAMLDEALGQSDLVASFDDARRRAGLS